MTDASSKRLSLPTRPQPPAVMTFLGGFLGFLLGLVLGPLLGSLTGLLAGCGAFAGTLFGGPGVWMAEDLRADLQPRFLSVPAAMLVGAATGLVVGPAWFCFLGTTAGRNAVEVAWRGKSPVRQRAM